MDPKKPINAVGQAPIVVLTGAGASASFGMPTMKEFFFKLTGEARTVAEKIFQDFPDKNNDLEFLLDQLNKYGDVMRELKLRQTGYFCHTVYGGNNASLSGGLSRMQVFERVRKAALDAIVENYGRLSVGQSKKAKENYLPLIKTLLELCSGEESGARLPIFTVNYDLSFEALGASPESEEFCTGVILEGADSVWKAEAYRTRQYKLPIFRLHGCSHWYRDPNNSQRIVYSPIAERVAREPVLLYPEAGKDERIDQEPFSTAYSYLRILLESAKVLVVVGYSCRDFAIQRAIQGALIQNPNLSIALVDKKDVPWDDDSGVRTDDGKANLIFYQDKHPYSFDKNLLGLDQPVVNMLSRVNSWGVIFSGFSGATGWIEDFVRQALKKAVTNSYATTGRQEN